MLYKSAGLALLLVSLLTGISSSTGSNVLDRLQNYTRIFGFDANDRNNELWNGIIKDCSKKVTFSCIQKNAYTYLDRTFIDRDNITVFDGLKLTRNNLDYEACYKDENKAANDNLVEDTEDGRRAKSDSKVDENNDEKDSDEEYLTPLEEVTQALRKKTFKFLATRDYEIKLPGSLGSGSSLKISPREIDENGALIRIDFNTRAVEEQEHGRIFIKKIKKQIQNKLLMAFLLLVLLIKIIKVKFMFVIPFLFGVGTAKKLFLKLLLFLVPAFAHVFKLCSSYYTSHSTKFHHHHHKIAHHHHHIPVPVPVYSSSKPGHSPVYYDHPPPSSSSHHHSHGPPSGNGPIILDEDFPGYDYAHPHIQYRKDMEELKEWGITPSDEPYDEVTPDPGVVYQRPSTQSIGPPFKMPKFPMGMPPPPPFANSKSGYGPFYPGPNKMLAPHNPQSLAYAGYAPHLPLPPLPQPQSAPRQPPPPSAVVPVFAQPTQTTKQPNYGPVVFTPQTARPVVNQPHRNDLQLSGKAPAAAAPIAVPPAAINNQQQQSMYDDEFYGPIVERLDDIYAQLRFLEESCRERLVCSMYKNPALYSPHSNLVSSELSRDPQELQQGNAASASSQRFYRYLNAARLGQDGGDCLKAFHCSIKTE